MPTCSIIGCTSGYRSNREKCHLFTVPRDPNVRWLWGEAIKPSGREIKSGQSVCEKHFHPKDIMWERQHLSPDGKLLGVTHYKVPRLQKGSVPSIFAWSELIMPRTDVSSDKLANSTESLVPLEEDVMVLSAVDSELGEEASPLLTEASQDAVRCTVSTERTREIIHPDNCITDHEEIFDAASQNLVPEESNTPIPSLTLEQLFTGDILMPSGWNKLMINHDGTIFVVYFTTKCTKIGDRLKTFVLKEVTLKADMTFQINALGKPVDEKDLNIDLSPINSIQRMQDLLVTLRALNICNGTKLSDQQSRDIGIDVYKDPNGSWRHFRCSLLCTTPVCGSCRLARKSAIAKRRRIEKRGGMVKKNHPTAASDDKWLLNKLQEKHRTSERAARRARNEIAKLKSKIAKYQDKVSKSTKSLEQYLKSVELSENQMCALREIVANAKCEYSRGERYSEEWILLCMLLHTRSPASYNSLRNNGILPLPHVRTVRRLLFKIETTCAVDP